MPIPFGAGGAISVRPAHAIRIACCALCVCATARAQAPAAPAPPEVLQRVDAVYPENALANREQGTSVLAITVELDGSVGDVEVIESSGEALDAAAVAAVRKWRFRPALSGGAPVRARIRVPFRFLFPKQIGPVEPARVVAAPVRPDARARAAPPIEINVDGERQLRARERSASDFEIERPLLEAAPSQEGADKLRTVPGLMLGRAEGNAVGHRYMLRGFDADHGQDIEFKVGGVPINVPSHIHGQGYTDLGFLLGEVVDEIHAQEGVYDPSQGDFAVAGSIDVSLAAERRGIQLRSSYGAFDSFRQVLLWAPPGQHRGTFGAIQYQRSDGYGENRRGQSASAIAQTVVGSGAFRCRALGIVYGARADHAGVVRADDVDAGRVGYYGVYPYPTARRQNAFAGRILAGVFGEYRGEADDNADAGFWLSLDDFRLQENFTGFTQRSQTLENVAGRGDLIEQRNRTGSLGLVARYRTAPYRPASWAHGTLELGLSGRFDQTRQAQNLLDAAVRSQTWDRRIDAGILGVDIGMWGDLDWHLTRHWVVRFGARADVLLYDVDDELGNFAPSSRPDDTYIVGFRRSAFGTAFGPRTSIESKPFDWLSIRAAYGEGYRSPQARRLDDGEVAPYSKVKSADLGVRFASADSELTLSSYYTQLSDDVAFEAEEGRLERVGRTRRLGAVLHAQTQPLAWLVGALSLTFVDAELLEPPPASAEEPQPAFEVGQNLPAVAPLVGRLDFGAHPLLAHDAAGEPVRGRFGLGFSYLSPRPLAYGDFADSVALLDASTGLGWGPLELTLEVFNLLDRRYASSEFTFASSWDPDGARTRTPARHLSAGPPRSWLLSLGVTL